MVQRQTVEYGFVYQGERYIVYVPEKFLRPLYVRLPDDHLIMQQAFEGPWQDVSWAVIGGLTIYQAQENKAPVYIPPVIFNQHTPEKGWSVVYTEQELNKLGRTYGVQIDKATIQYMSIPKCALAMANDLDKRFPVILHGSTVIILRDGDVDNIRTWVNRIIGY